MPYYLECSDGGCGVEYKNEDVSKDELNSLATEHGWFGNCGLWLCPFHAPKNERRGLGEVQEGKTMSEEIKNAVIDRVSIFMDDHGLLTAYLYLEYGGAAQGFGGYQLWPLKSEEKGAGLFIWRVMETVGVSAWEDLKGKPVRVRGDRMQIREIGHYIKDQWFCPSREME